ncbi:MAG: flagellar filament capping protein FliD [Porticoccaceae bacterium]
MITSLGAGSGIDIESLVSQLVAAEREPAQQRLDRREAGLQAQLSALGTFKAALSSFRTAVGGLAGSALFHGVSAQSSDSKVLSVRADPGATVGSHALEVTQLATAHGLAASAVASKADAFGTGTLTFRFGTTSHDPDTGAYTGFTPNPQATTHTVTIDATNNSLAGIRDAVNRAGIGVNASIIQDGSGYRLVFSAAATGAANSLEISVQETAGDNTDDQGLSRLAYHAGATQLVQTQAAQDAALRIDGLPIGSAGNSLSGVLDGLDLELVGIGSANFTVAADQGAATKAIDEFVRVYNALIDNIGALTRVDPGTGQGSVLTGDAMLRSTANRLHALTTGAVPGLAGMHNALASLGIGTNPETGKLVKDEARFASAIAGGLEDIAPLFADAGSASDSLVHYLGAGPATAVGNHELQITRMATRGQLSGGAVSEPLVITPGVNDTLTLTIDGVDSGELRLAGGSYSGAELAAELQARIGGASALSSRGVAAEVSFEGGSFTLVSARWGSASQVAAQGAAAATLGLAGGVATAGVDVAGSIAGEPATGSGRRLTGTGRAAELQLEIEGGAPGNRGTVSFTRGIAARLTEFVDSLIGGEDLVGARTRGIETRIDEIDDQRAQLDRRLAALDQRFRAQFIAMDRLVSQLQGTSDFLTQQFAALPGSRAS